MTARHFATAVAVEAARRVLVFVATIRVAQARGIAWTIAAALIVWVLWRLLCRLGEGGRADGVG